MAYTSINFGGRFPCHAVATQIAVTTLKNCVGCDNRYDNAYSVGVPITTGSNVTTNSITFQATLRNYMSSTTLASKNDWIIVLVANKYQSTATVTKLSTLKSATKIASTTFTTKSLGGGSSTTISLTLSNMSLSPNTTYYVYIYDTHSAAGSYHSLCYLDNLTITSDSVTQNKHTVSFNKNGGSGTMSSVSVDHGSYYTLPKCTFTPPAGGTDYVYIYRHGNGGNDQSTISAKGTFNYSFDDWKSSSGGYYNVGSSCVINSNTTFSATWDAGATTTGQVALGATTRKSESQNGQITLNANGGNCNTSYINFNREVSYKFMGWSEDSRATNYKYNSTSLYTFYEDIDLYAVWQENSKAEAIKLPTPTRTGYVFTGWATSPDATSGNVNADAYIPTDQYETLYATWLEYQQGVLVYVFHDGAWTMAFPQVYSNDHWYGSLTEAE